MSEQPNTTAPEDQQVDLLALLGLLWDSRYWIIAISALGAGIAAMYASSQTPIYSANALIQVEPGNSGVLSVQDIGSLRGSGAAAEIALIESRFVLGQVVDELSLNVFSAKHYYPYIGKFMASRFSGPAGTLAKPFYGEGYAWGGEQLELARFNVPPQAVGGALTLQAQSANIWALYPGSPDNFDSGTAGAPLLTGTVGELAENNGFSTLVQTLVAHPGTLFQVQSQRRQNAILGLQGRLNIAPGREGSGMLRLFLEHPNPAVAESILNAVAALYVKQNIERSSAPIVQSLNFLRDTLPGVREDLEAAEKRLNNYQIRNGIIDISAEAGVVFSESVRLQQQLTELKFQRRDIQGKYQPDHPAYQDWLFRIAETEARQQKLEKEIARLPQTQQELIRLRRNVALGNDIYLQMLSKIQQLDIAKAGAVGNTRVIDQAVSSSGPIKPRKSMITLIGLVAGIIAGCLLILGRAAFNRGIENPEVIEKMGLPVYSGIPFSTAQRKLTSKSRKKSDHGDEKSQLLALINPADPVVEALRSLRTSLHFAMLGASNNVLMITGPSTNVGKTFLSTNLAVVMAQSGQKVLLIDADLRRGTSHIMMGVPNGKGLSAVLLGNATIDQVARNTGANTLDFISRGSAPVSPSELLMGKGFADLLGQASKQYDLVIIDTPPILAVTDAAIVGKYAGTTMLITRFGLNPAKEIDLARKRFELNGVTIKGVVFNAIVKKASAYGYGSYRYYNYNYKSEKN
jgi:tyrosine-protein kinase Etk/Wzc